LVEFDVGDLCLLVRTEGVLIDMEPSSFILPAQASHTHSAFFIAREPGHLGIKGCKIKFSACKLRHFPIRRERNRREKEIWYDIQGGEIKVRPFGGHTPIRNTRTDVSQVSNIGVTQDTFWLEETVDATVLPLQPILILESSSLRDACMMLLEGEV
jgi:Transport protein Trs120 or TRAPPC9, TRAPP II complex subunit